MTIEFQVKEEELMFEGRKFNDNNETDIDLLEKYFKRLDLTQKQKFAKELQQINGVAHERVIEILLKLRLNYSRDALKRTVHNNSSMTAQEKTALSSILEIERSALNMLRRIWTTFGTVDPDEIRKIVEVEHPRKHDPIGYMKPETEQESQTEQN